MWCWHGHPIHAWIPPRCPVAWLWSGHEYGWRWWIWLVTNLVPHIFFYSLYSSLLLHYKPTCEHYFHNLMSCLWNGKIHTWRWVVRRLGCNHAPQHDEAFPHVIIGADFIRSLAVTDNHKNTDKQSWEKLKICLKFLFLVMLCVFKNSSPNNIARTC